MRPNTTPPTFFLVWSPAGRTPPSKRHVTEAAARQEAERLAAENPGSEFYVLQAQSVSAAPRVITTNLDTIPV